MIADNGLKEPVERGCRTALFHEPRFCPRFWDFLQVIFFRQFGLVLSVFRMLFKAPEFLRSAFTYDRGRDLQELIQVLKYHSFQEMLMSFRKHVRKRQKRHAKFSPESGHREDGLARTMVDEKTWGEVCSGLEKNRLSSDRMAVLPL